MSLIGLVVLVGALLVALCVVAAVGILIGLRLKREADLTELVPVVSPADVDAVELPDGIYRPTSGDDLPSIGERR